MAFSVTAPGAALSSAFLPGFKITLVAISLVLMAACVAPLIFYIVQAARSNLFFFQDCLLEVQKVANCTNVFTRTIDDVGDDFVDCLGLEMTDPFIYPLFCSPTYTAILPQWGLFQTLALTLQSDIVFYSDAEGDSAQLDELMTKMVGEGAACSGNRCSFGFVQKLYRQNIAWMFLGSILLLVLGVLMATLFIYPPKWMVRARHAMRNLFNFRKRKQGQIDKEAAIEEMSEVAVERQAVRGVIRPFLAGPVDIEANNDANDPALSYSARDANADQLPPVLMTRLGKVFPPLGGAPAKVALKSLDLMVPRGEVLGLLGKNGAGELATILTFGSF